MKRKWSLRLGAAVLYRTGAENKMSGAAAAKTINIVHSDSYKTTFSYNRWEHLYKMSMYSRSSCTR